MVRPIRPILLAALNERGWHPWLRDCADRPDRVLRRGVTLTKAMGLELDLTARGLGVRSQRFALVAEDKKVTHLAIEAPGDFDVSRAEAVLELV